MPAPGPLKRLYFEIKAVDFQGNTATTGLKEAFYLNENLQSETFVLNGANLILMDYTPQEQNKLYAWFKSYLNIAKEVGFVPIEAKSPLFIFMGKEYDFMQIRRATFMHYTRAITPGETKIAVHRLTVGLVRWSTLPEKNCLPSETPSCW